VSPPNKAPSSRWGFVISSDLASRFALGESRPSAKRKLRFLLAFAANIDQGKPSTQLPSREEVRMKRKTPGVILVVAVFHFVFATLDILGSICGGLVFVWMAGASPHRGDPFSQVLAITWQALRQIPGYLPIAIAQMIVSLGLGIVLIIAGIGLLRLRNWARMLSIAYAVFNLLLQIAWLVYHLAVIVPAINRALNQALPPGLQQAGMFGSPTDNISTFGGVAINILHSVFVLVVMLLPSVAARFAEASDRYAYDDGYDEDDRDYDRRRRDDDWDR
jgi:hypothetical protein